MYTLNEPRRGWGVDSETGRTLSTGGCSDLECMIPRPPGPPKPRKRGMECRNCGALNAENARFCANCGASLASAKCWNCGTDSTPGAKFCANCGSDLAQPGVRPASQRGSGSRLRKKK